MAHDGRWAELDRVDARLLRSARELAVVPAYRERRLRKSTLAEGEGFEPPKACTLVVFKPRPPFDACC
jgi:hypothetical protein